MAQAESSRGRETVLVVEDSPLVRKLMQEVLELNGYRVYEAANGHAALEIAGQPGMHLDLLLTDVTLPGMNGRELADALTARQPDLKVVFASGHGSDALGKFGVAANAGFLEKPFSPKDLARKVREILDARS